MIILHTFLLIFNVKKVADFLYHRPEMLRNITCGKIFNCLFLLHGKPPHSVSYKANIKQTIDDPVKTKRRSKIK